MAEQNDDDTLFDRDGNQARPWKLPFWTEEATHKVDREQQTALAMRRREPEPQPEPEPEPEEELHFPTAEELENIRREAYNEGLEQGLVEGRQNGEKKGYQDGQAKGKAEGRQQGEKEGRSEGFKAGHAEAIEQMQQQVQAMADRFQALEQLARQSLIERDRQLPEMLAGLVVMATEQVLRYELADGAKAVYDYVQSALQQLPEGADAQARVYVSAADASQLEGHLADFGLQLDFSIDNSLQAGQCCVKTPDTRVDYRVYDHLQELLEQLAPTLMQNVPDDSQLAADLDAGLESQLEQTVAQREAEGQADSADDAAELASQNESNAESVQADSSQSDSSRSDSAQSETETANTEGPRAETQQEEPAVAPETANSSDSNPDPDPCPDGARDDTL